MTSVESSYFKQAEQYEVDGFLLLPELFSYPEVHVIRERVGKALAQDSPRRVLERDGKTVRSVYGLHFTDHLFSELTRDPRILGLVEVILGHQVYVHQSKANAKLALDGDVWAWHQDYTFWLEEDGIQAPDLTTVAIFLDDVTEFNGPISLIPGSHKHVLTASKRSNVPAGYEGSGAWITNLTADLKYTVPRESLACLVSAHGIMAPKGNRGSALIFHSNLVHGSTSNLSPFDRVLALVTYNSVENLPKAPNSRPDFLCGRDYTPLTPLTAPLGITTYD